MLRIFVAATPALGAISFPLIVSIIISRIGLAQGVLSALILTVIWFSIMLITSEMPH